jgi:hypothetical protein
MGNDHKNISRRDFLKATVLGLGATFLAACGRALDIPVTPSPTTAPTSTDTRKNHGNINERP